MSLTRRTIISTSWNVVSHSAKVVILIIRSIVLARWLPVAVFGVYGFASAIVALSSAIVAFGMAPAFLHRASETENEEQTAAVHFTLRLIITLLWAGALAIGAFIFTEGQNRVALLVLIVAVGGLQLTETPRLILIRRVIHRRLALVELTTVLLATLISLTLAWYGATLGALLVVDLVGWLVPAIALYVWRPVWRPRVVWLPSVMRYFFRFGRHMFFSNMFVAISSKIDDLWVGSYLGETALGFYSRAYSFANYPRTIIATPITTVVAGTYAELKDDRLRLSQAFFRTTALLVRASFFLAGLMALIAPEFIRLVLGDKWLPMLDAFRLMLLFTLLDPIQKTVTQLLTAVGRPDYLARARFLQLIVLIPGLFFLGPWLEIAGVALAVNLMFGVGITLLLWQVRSYIDISFWRLFAAPGLALLVGMLLARSAITLPGILGSDWRTGLVKLVVFSVIYGAILILCEYRQLLKIFSIVVNRVSSKQSSHSSVVSKAKNDKLNL